MNVSSCAGADGHGTGYSDGGRHRVCGAWLGYIPEMCHKLCDDVMMMMLMMMMMMMCRLFA